MDSRLSLHVTRYSSPFKNGVQRLRGASQRQVADVEVLHAAIDERSNRARANIDGRGASGEFGLQLLYRYRQELAECGEGFRIRAAVVEHAEHSGHRDAGAVRLVQKR